MANKDSSHPANDPFGGLKHHLRLIYKKKTSANAIKAKVAPRNVVISIGTRIKKIYNKFYLTAAGAAFDIINTNLFVDYCDNAAILSRGEWSTA